MKPTYGTPQSVNSPHSIHYPKCALTLRPTSTNINSKTTTNTETLTSEQKDNNAENHQATEGVCLPPSPMITLQVEAPGATEANKCSDQTHQNYFKCYSQNVQGLRSNEDKLEYILRLMTRKTIDAYLLQETHLEGDFTKILPGRNLMIHHGPESQPRQKMHKAESPLSYQQNSKKHGNKVE